MNYLSIQTLASVFQGTISLLPLLVMTWGELRVSEKLQLMGVSKHHGTSFHENVCHLSYLPFINGKSLNQLSHNLPYHQSVFSDLWDKVVAIRWWQLVEAVSDELLFGQVKFPNIAKDAVLVIDDTPIEKFGLSMENISGVRTSSGRIGMGYVAFLACVLLPDIAHSL
jgi:hypothetical protein